jgi:hypothetical protein
MLTSKLRSINHTGTSSITEQVRTVVVEAIRGRDAANTGCRVLRDR